MASPRRDEIESYMSLTGASESVAFQKLQEFGGDLNDALDAHFSETRNPSPSALPSHNVVQSNNENHFGRGIGQMLSAARSFRPSLLLDPNYRRNMYGHLNAAGRSLLSPTPVRPHATGERPEQPPAGYSTTQPDNDVEEEMIQAAIRASLRDPEVFADDELLERQVNQEDIDLARAVDLSLKTAEQDRAVCEGQMRDIIQSQPGGSSNQNEAQHFDDELVIRRKSYRGAGNNKEAFCTGEKSDWRKNIIPELQPINGPASPSYSASRFLKEQQDMEYKLSLLMDRQKEEDSSRKMFNELECERTLAAKKASLPCEPALDNENAVTLLVRMADGNRASRRFLKSEKLQFLFDFIDISGQVKSGAYRLVRPYPRRVFTSNESLSTFTELGLTNKLEALFLEMI